MTQMERIREELEQIKKDNSGFLRAEDVVAFAKDPDTALHSRFNWDNASAGHAWRLEQARQLIRVQVTIIDGEQTEPIRTYVNLSAERHMRDANGKRTRGYRGIRQVLDGDSLRKQALSDALAEYERVGQRYRHLLELAEVRKAVAAARRKSRETRQTSARPKGNSPRATV